MGCTSLESITLGGSVSTIGNDAFYGCTNLANIRFLGEVPTSFGFMPFESIPNPITVTVPSGERSAYEAALSSLLPTGSTFVEASSGLTVGGITGTSISGTVSYNPATQTFTLNNAVITPARITGGGIRHAITSESDLKVVLVGHNVLGTAPQDPSDSSNYTISSGIYAPGKDLTVTGAGSLTIYNHTSGIEGKNVTIDITGTLRVQEYGTGVMACC